MTDLLYSDVEESLRSSVRGALKRTVDPSTVAALYDAPDTDVSPAWSALAGDLGLAGLLVPEERGGAGASAREASVVLEELGRAVAPVPFLESAVIATTALLAVDARDVLPQVASGDRRAVLVLPWSARAGAWSAGEAVTAPVAGALGADLFLVPTSVDGTVRLVLHETADVTPLTSLDMSRPLASVAPTDEGRVLAEGEAAVAAVDAALAAGAALLASEQLGVAQWCLETTVEYAKTRIQFARPIGSFQAIKHRLADLYLEVTQAQAAARYAADTLAAQDPDAPVAQAVAQSYCSDVAVHAAEEALQLHGGIGMTWEHGVHLYLKRAKSDQLALGTPAAHRADLAGLVDLPQH
ncbi:acyl-CoA dehydrogenase family protein [Aeromicrobium duanguangcaii]|uniref:Acyl-CoA/acyl-ACP dehydrogenase n=1 Tax=Aeromicrobium duanguangcaii TaxID=2968086 RepID=A0ABY5KGU7_9ACTN|nr:acyl-CoA dehydrogenase family protein [Aeromicrobium duanguangcaii]MCD9153897.1 acyl-CoA/acyl-ACP dehydrogenase [Aeromicrobium duanguangcaii]UUI69024.1 acyl-CoA/acyl-ACP dehydrogenase [Aeromicrobium duanguangcaii]